MTAMAPLRNEGASKTAYFAARVIPAGTPISEDMLSARRIAENFSPETAGDKSEIIGSFAAVDIVSGDVIMKSKLTPEPPDDFGGVLTGGKVAISVSIKNFAYGLSGHLEAGDVVSVFASHDGYGAQGGVSAAADAATASASSGGSASDGGYWGYGGGIAAPPELKYVSVLAVTSGDGTDRSEYERAAREADGQSGDAEWSAATLTFLASPAQAELLAALEANGVMQFALVYRGDKAVADEFLAKQDEYLTKTSVGKAGNESDKSSKKNADGADDAATDPENEGAETGGGTGTGVDEDAGGE
jgi:pilus assembly protein CpaB